MERQEVFKREELESMGQKLKGVISQSVKEVLTSLVGDNMVESDKIGSSTYYWAFPAKIGAAKQMQYKQLKEIHDAARKKLKSLDKQLAEREASDNPAEKAKIDKALLELDGLKELNKTCKENYKLYEDVDPDKYQAKQEQLDTAKEAVERWTDNIFSIRKWIKEKTGMSEAEVNKQFGIPQDFDYLE